ncbi:uncharacterized protein LOC116138436 [Pistacia vera]|uniref:uncharacterized protein LOC116138436 n=1 Tax=Pistacia vera TaxID=55513 RepID=UPI001262D8C5|nr:uncharacterized protein LOC116138436 [Pistacia vera]
MSKMSHDQFYSYLLHIFTINLCYNNQEQMAEGIVFSIAGKILKELGSLAVQEGKLAWGVNDEIRKLNNTINTIKLVLLDAEEQHSKMNHVVIDWIQRLKGAFYEAGDLLDDFSIELQRREVMTGNKLIKEKLKGWWRRDMDNGAEFPSFSSLSKLDAQTCPMLTFMPLYPSLEELKLRQTSSKPLEQTMMLMNRVGASTSSSFSAPLSNLKSMLILRILDLESLPVEMMQNLTSLVDFKILPCPRLNEVEQAVKFLPSLQNLTLRSDEELYLLSDDMKWKNLRRTVLGNIPAYR